jgi:aryl-alcohol dehydrogenase-like predicted oxidoreductase
MIPVLGTAMWGWTIGQDDAFRLADRFYEKGGRWFDTASNYPIDKVPEHFGLASRWLSDWIGSRGRRDAKVILKVGGVSNDGSPAFDLSEEVVRTLYRRSQDAFPEGPHVFSIHWDNRDDEAAIQPTIDVLNELSLSGQVVGLSGVKHPEIYSRRLADQARPCWIQVKHNILTQAAYASYQPFHGVAHFLAYGVNAAGLKFGQQYSAANSAVVRGAPTSLDIRRFERMVERWRDDPFMPKTFNELGLAFLTLTPDIKGVIIGPSKTSQLDESLAFLAAFDEPSRNAHLTEKFAHALKEAD